MNVEKIIEDGFVLQRQLYDFLIHKLDFPSFFRQIQERFEELEEEKKSLEHKLEYQQRTQELTKRVLVDLIHHELEEDVFISARECKLTSVQYHVEFEGFDIDTRCDHFYEPTDIVIMKVDKLSLY